MKLSKNMRNISYIVIRARKEFLFFFMFSIQSDNKLNCWKQQRNNFFMLLYVRRCDDINSTGCVCFPLKKNLFSFFSQTIWNEEQKFHPITHKKISSFLFLFFSSLFSINLLPFFFLQGIILLHKHFFLLLFIDEEFFKEQKLSIVCWSNICRLRIIFIFHKHFTFSYLCFYPGKLNFKHFFHFAIFRIILSSFLCPGRLEMTNSWNKLRRERKMQCNFSCFLLICLVFHGWRGNFCGEFAFFAEMNENLYEIVLKFFRQFFEFFFNFLD